MGVTNRTTTSMGELEEPLMAALRRLIRKEDDLHPFIVVEPERKGSRIFVQFAGSRGRPLVFDVPPEDIVNFRIMAERGPDLAYSSLVRQGALHDEALVITEEEDTPWFGRGILGWLFGHT